MKLSLPRLYRTLAALELSAAGVSAKPSSGKTVGVLVLAAAFALKAMYSSAGADRLAFVLAPSCWVASTLSGIELVAESGAGFISHRYRMVVGSACAGVNFLVIAWLALYFCGQARLRGTRRKLLWAIASVLLAYAATCLTNGLRIVLAAHFFEAEVHAGVLTAARVHRLLGIVLYGSTLLGLCRAAERMLPGRSAGLRLAPLLWYLAVMIGLPLLHRGWLQGPARFVEHALFTVGVCALLAGCARLAGALRDRIRSSPAS